MKPIKKKKKKKGQALLKSDFVCYSGGWGEEREKCKKQTPLSPVRRIGFFSKVEEKNNCTEYFFFFPLIFLTALVFGGTPGLTVLLTKLSENMTYAS